MHQLLHEKEEARVIWDVAVHKEVAMGRSFPESVLHVRSPREYGSFHDDSVLTPEHPPSVPLLSDGSAGLVSCRDSGHALGPASAAPSSLPASW